jgi:hypothetical protein
VLLAKPFLAPGVAADSVAWWCLTEAA